MSAATASRHAARREHRFTLPAWLTRRPAANGHGPLPAPAAASCKACSPLDYGRCTCPQDCGWMCCTGGWRDVPPEAPRGAPMAPELAHDYQPASGWAGESHPGVIAPDLDVITLTDVPWHASQADRAGRQEALARESAGASDVRPWSPANGWEAPGRPEDPSGSWGPWDTAVVLLPVYVPDFPADRRDLPVFRTTLRMKGWCGLASAACRPGREPDFRIRETFEAATAETEMAA